MEKLNVLTMELVQKKKDEISKLKKTKFSVTNNQTKLVKTRTNKNKAQPGTGGIELLRPDGAWVEVRSWTVPQHGSAVRRGV